MKALHKVIDYGLTAVVVALIIAIHALLGKVPHESILQILGLLVLVTGVAAIVAAGVAAIRTREIYTELRTELTKIHELLATLSAGNIVDDDYVAKYEAACRAKHIWIISPDLHKDIELPGEGTCFGDIVYNNIVKRDITYTYLLPDVPEIEAKVRALRTRYKDSERERLRIYRLSTDKWARLPFRDGDFAIYNPLLDSGVERLGIYELPTGGRNRWVKVDDQTVIAWAGLIQTIVPELGEMPRTSWFSRFATRVRAGYNKGKV